MEDYPEESLVEEQQYDINSLASVINQLSPEDKVKFTKMVKLESELQLSDFEQNKKNIIKKAKAEATEKAIQEMNLKTQEKEQIRTETEERVKNLLKSDLKSQESNLSSELNPEALTQINSKVDKIQHDLVDMIRHLKEYTRTYVNSMNKEQAKGLLEYIDGVQKSSDDIRELKKIQEIEEKNRLRELELQEKEPEATPGVIGNLFNTAKDTFTGVTGLFNTTTGNLGSVLAMPDLNQNLNKESGEEEEGDGEEQISLEEPNESDLLQDQEELNRELLDSYIPKKKSNNKKPNSTQKKKLKPKKKSKRKINKKGKNKSIRIVNEI